MGRPTVDTGRRCLECDYNLTGVASDRCPECGWRIDSALIDFARGLQPPRERFWLLIVLSATAGVGLFFVFVVTSADLRMPTSGLRTALFAASAVVCGLHLVLVLVSAASSRWPVQNVWIARVCRAAALIQLGLVGASVPALTPSGPPGVVGFVVVCVFLGAPALTLLFSASVALTTRRRALASLQSQMRRAASPRQSAAPFVVEFAGSYCPSDIVVETENATPRVPHPLVEPCIDATWTRLHGERSADGPALYDSSLGRLAGWSIIDGRPRLRIGETTYREFVGTNLFNSHLLRSVGSDHFAHALGTSAIVTTADGSLVLGRRNARVLFHAGHLHPFGGMLEAADRTGEGSYDVFAAVRRELTEELDVTQSEIEDVVCTGMARDVSIYQPELLFSARLSVTLAELRARFSAEHDEEHAAFEACDDLPGAVTPFIAGSDRITPVAVAAMLLHGRHLWGADWFESASYVLFSDLPRRTRG